MELIKGQFSIDFLQIGFRSLSIKRLFYFLELRTEIDKQLLIKRLQIGSLVGVFVLQVPLALIFYLLHNYVVRNENERYNLF